MHKKKYNIPETFPFSTGLPFFPMYGFDSMEQDKNDHDYMKQLYSSLAKSIQLEIEEECDKLEYAGSCMYHERPDPVRLSMISATIYERVQNNSLPSYNILESTSIASAPECRGSNCPPPKPPCRGGMCPPPMPPCRGGNCPPPNPPCRGGMCPPPRPDFLPDGNPDWLKQLIDHMLYEEVNHRRRRYRSRHPW